MMPSRKVRKPLVDNRNPQPVSGMALLGIRGQGRPRTNPAVRFVKNFQMSDGCWEWQGASKDGYGVFDNGQTKVLAHRFSYELYVADIPNGLWVLHRCDNPPCVNPDHLFLGTARDNVHDMMAKGRRYVRPKKAT